MKSLMIFTIWMLSFSVYGQIEQYKSSSATILGYQSDSLFEVDCHKAIIILNTTSEDLKVVIFKKDIQDDNAQVTEIFQELEGDIQLTAKLDENIFEISDNTTSSHTVNDFASLTINGVTNQVAITYQIHGMISSVNRTSGSLFTEAKITLSLFFNPNDFDFPEASTLSNTIELNIFEGILNEQN